MESESLINNGLEIPRDYFFQMEAFREQIKFQTAVAINQISLPLLASVKVPVPPRVLLDEFATFTKQVNKSKFHQ